MALRDLGRTTGAATRLSRARDTLRTDGRGLEAARAALDLLHLHAEAGTPGPFADETERLSGLLFTSNLSRPAVATLLRFQSLARRTGPDPELTYLARRELAGPWVNGEPGGETH